MLLWLSLYYLAPALLCDRLVRLLVKRVTADTQRKWLLVIGMTLSWTPLIMTVSERTGPVQFLLAIAHLEPAQPQAASWWQQGLLVGAAFLIARYLVFRTRSPAPPPRD